RAHRDSSATLDLAQRLTPRTRSRAMLRRKSDHAWSSFPAIAFVEAGMLLGRYSRDLLLQHRSLPRERRHEDGRLFQLVLAHALRVVSIGMARALVVRGEVLDNVETGQPDLVEGHMIGSADALDNVARRTQILQ